MAHDPGAIRQPTDLPAAAVQAAVFGLVKAAGVRGFERATGAWPG